MTKNTRIRLAGYIPPHSSVDSGLALRKPPKGSKPEMEFWIICSEIAARRQTGKSKSQKSKATNDKAKEIDHVRYLEYYCSLSDYEHQIDLIPSHLPTPHSQLHKAYLKPDNPLPPLCPNLLYMIIL